MNGNNCMSKTLGFFKTAATRRNMVSPPTISDHRLVKTTISELISWKIPYPPLQSASAACINKKYAVLACMRVKRSLEQAWTSLGHAASEVSQQPNEF